MTMFKRWLDALTDTAIGRKLVVGAAGVALAGGALAGPAVAATDTSPPLTPAAVTATVTGEQPGDKPGEKPGMDTLVPHGVQGTQSHVALTDEQRDNAKKIIEATKNNGMDERAAVVAIATALQESKLINLGHLGARNDHDSQGLFQQRPSSGWGTVEQIRDPQYSTTAFLNGLKQVEGWRDMPLTQAAQKVQVSAHPFLYAQWETQAAELVADLWNTT